MNNKNAINIYGEGKYSSDRQTFTDDTETFRGTQAEASAFFQKKYPSKSLIVDCYPKKRIKGITRKCTYEFATFLHQIFCKQDHIERCDWFYRDWENLGEARTEYLAKAKRVMKKYKISEVAQAHKIIQGVERT